MIRPATPADKAAILEVAVDSGLFPPEHVGELAALIDEQLDPAADEHHWIVDERAVEVAAAAYHAPEALADGTHNLYFIAVREALKGQGLGSALLRHVEDRLRASGARVLIVETSGLDGFTLTRAFYRKHGYAEEARIRDFYADGDDKVVFWRQL